MDYLKSPIYCEHANEMPNICPCPPNCYCRGPEGPCGARQSSSYLWTGVYRNKKNGKLYTVTDEAINATNAQDGQQMIAYRSSDGQLYVREKAEFLAKFDSVEKDDASD